MTYKYQEFKCNKCPGFWVLRLHRKMQGKVLLVCPKCGRRHQRDVIEGVIKDVGKQSNEGNIQEIISPTSCFREQPVTKLLQEAHEYLPAYDRTNRNGSLIKQPDDLVDPSLFSKYQNNSTRS